MFAQQPQYGGQQAYQRPQQYAGYQPQQPPQQHLSASQMLDQIDSQSSKSAFNADSRPGDSVTGIIENVTANQVRDFQTRQPAFWNDGSPQLQVLVTIDTGHTDPGVQDDDGRRTVYIKGWGVQRRAWLQAIRNAGLHKASDIRPGDRFTATFTGYGERGNAPQPPKLFEYTIEHQSAADLAMGQQQPLQQANTPQPSPAYPPQQYAPQQTPQAMNPGYSTPADPWNTQPQQSRQPNVDPLKVQQLKQLGKSPQEIAGMLGVPVETVTAVTDRAQPQNHGGSEQDPDF